MMRKEWVRMPDGKLKEVYVNCGPSAAKPNHGLTAMRRGQTMKVIGRA